MYVKYFEKLKIKAQIMHCQVLELYIRNSKSGGRGASHSDSLLRKLVFGLPEIRMT